MAHWRELTFPGVHSDAEMVVDDERASILTNPLRWRILESLGSGKSVAELSEALGVTDARMSYHLERLANTGVVHFEEGSDPRARRCEPVAAHLRVKEMEATSGVSPAMPISRSVAP